MQSAAAAAACQLHDSLCANTLEDLLTVLNKMSEQYTEMYTRNVKIEWDGRTPATVAQLESAFVPPNCDEHNVGDEVLHSKSINWISPA